MVSVTRRWFVAWSSEWDHRDPIRFDSRLERAVWKVGYLLDNPRHYGTVVFATDTEHYEYEVPADEGTA